MHSSEKTVLDEYLKYPSKWDENALQNHSYFSLLTLLMFCRFDSVYRNGTRVQEKVYETSNAVLLSPQTHIKVLSERLFWNNYLKCLIDLRLGDVILIPPLLSIFRGSIKRWSHLRISEWPCAGFWMTRKIQMYVNAADLAWCHVDKYFAFSSAVNGMPQYYKLRQTLTSKSESWRLLKWE